MAAVKKIDNEGLLNAAYELVRREGLSALSARKLAIAASCSTQPIYENFSGMDKVVEITTQRINEAFAEVVEAAGTQENASYGIRGVVACRYADEEKVLFRHFVVDNSRGNELLDNKWAAGLLEKTYAVSTDDVKIIDSLMRNYILGKAFLVNSGYEKFDAEKIEREIDQYLEYAVGICK